MPSNLRPIIAAFRSYFVSPIVKENLSAVIPRDISNRLAGIIASILIDCQGGSSDIPAIRATCRVATEPQESRNVPRALREQAVQLTIAKHHLSQPRTYHNSLWGSDEFGARRDGSPLVPSRILHGQGPERVDDIVDIRANLIPPGAKGGRLHASQKCSVVTAD